MLSVIPVGKTKEALRQGVTPSSFSWQALVYGRKTFDSIGKALPGRANLVLTRSAHDPVEGIEFVTDLAAAIEKAGSCPSRQ